MIDKILEAIKNAILKEIPEIKSCYIYNKQRGKILAPAVFLEVANYGAGDDPATEELALVANIEARVVVDVLDEESEIACQTLACRIADLAHLNNFGCDIQLGEVSAISRDSFKPEFDPFVCWCVEWSHQLHCGKSVWNNDGVQPHIIYINGEKSYG